MRRSIRWAVSFAIACSLSVVCAQESLTGRVTAKRDGEVKVEYAAGSRNTPAVGDSVAFEATIQGIKAGAGSGKVTVLGDGHVWVSVTDRRPNLDMVALITATAAPEAPRIPPATAPQQRRATQREADRTVPKDEGERAIPEKPRRVFEGASSQMTFDDVELRTDYGRAESGDDGKLVVTANRIRFMKNVKKGDEYFSLPAGAVKEIFYSRVSGRRIGAAILVSPLLLLSKGRKHYMTLTFDDGGQLVGAIEFKLHKSNYRGTLRAIEQVTDLTMEYDQEGVKDEKQTVASRNSASAKGINTGLSINSQPAAAEIQIDGSYAGVTPSTKALQPGKYKLKLIKRGFRDWEREVIVTAGALFELNPELEEK